MRTFPLLFLFACPAPEVEPEGPFVADIPPACGLAPYDWQPDTEMGRIVDWELALDASLSAGTIDGMLNAAGYGAFGPVNNGVVTYRIRYLTQDQGEVVEATGLLSFPDVPGGGPYPVVGWMHPTMGFTNECAPTAGDLLNRVPVALIASMGYAVAAPDFLGMAGWGEPSDELHPYVVPEPTAVASLDAIRALYRFQAGEGDVAVPSRGEERVVLWGASEGGFAALWSDRYRQSYAPEIEVIGVVASVPPTDMEGLAVGGLSEVNDATVGVAGVLTTSWLWYGQPGELTEILQDEPPTYLASSIVDAMWAECAPRGLFQDGDGIEDVFQPDFVAGVLAEDWEGLGSWGCMLQHGTLRNSALPRDESTPVLLQVSENDDLVLGPVIRADAPRLCEAGYKLEYLECAGASHVSGAADSLPYQLDWVRRAFAGEPLATDCVVGEPVDCRALSNGGE